MGISLKQMTNAVKKSKEYIDTNTLDLSSANFVSENGFGGLRIQDGKYQYYNKNTSSWVDIQYTDDNAYIGNLIPNPVTVLCAELDESTHNVKIKLTEPEDTKVNDSTTYPILGIKVVMKRGSEPETVDDGDLLLDLTRKKFGMYTSEWYTNTDISVMNTDTYYCKAFSYNEFGIYNNDGTVSSFSYTAPEVYGFTLDQSESDPKSMITYFGNNELYTPVSVKWDATAFKSFDYGDWKNVWFIKDCKPCMLKYDGTVDYYLDNTDYTKKVDGTDSDISDTTYEGNAMIEFPKVYIKYEIISEDKMNIYVSNTKLDSSYHCYAHIDSNGNEIDHLYMSIYDGKLIDDKLRSIAGQLASYGTFNDFVTYGSNNNLESSNIWSIGTYAENQMLIVLMMLITKCANHKVLFGRLLCGSVGNWLPTYKGGTIKNKDLFWFSNGDYHANMLFGMENISGVCDKHILGLIKDASGIQKVKMYKTDGSDDYNTTGEGYHEIGETGMNINGSYTNKMHFTEYGLLPKTNTGSQTTYYGTYCCLADVANTNVVMTGVYGCSAYYTATMFGVGYMPPDSKGINRYGHLRFPAGARISCRPLAKTTK